MRHRGEGRSLPKSILPLGRVHHEAVNLGPWGSLARAWLTGKQDGGGQLKVADSSVPRIPEDSGARVWEWMAGTILLPYQGPRIPACHETQVRPRLPCSLPSLLLPWWAPGLGSAQEEEWRFLNVGGGRHRRCMGDMGCLSLWGFTIDCHLSTVNHLLGPDFETECLKGEDS